MSDLGTDGIGATLLFTRSRVDVAYSKMASWLTETILDSPRPVMLVGPMQGALLVLSEMIRRIDAKFIYRAVKVSLYDAANQAGQSATFDYWPITDAELSEYDFIVVDDVAETLRTYVAMKERLAAHGAKVQLLTLIDKPVANRVEGMQPDFAPLLAGPDAWLIGEGMNDGSNFAGEAWRCEKGVWVKNP